MKDKINRLRDAVRAMDAVRERLSEWNWRLHPRRDETERLLQIRASLGPLGGDPDWTVYAGALGRFQGSDLESIIDLALAKYDTLAQSCREELALVAEQFRITRDLVERTIEARAPIREDHAQETANGSA